MNVISGTILNLFGFITGVVLLEKGADKFVDATALLAQKIHVPDVYIGLLTAGGEWEELIVVVIALIKGHDGLAIGNIIGSITANILGSFSLGLLSKNLIIVDRSSKIYSCIMFFILLLTSCLFFTNTVNQVSGWLLIILFVIYIISIAKGIYNGILESPEDSDSDSDSDSDNDSDNSSNNNLEVQPTKLYIYVLTILFGLILTSLGGWLIVESSVYFAKLFGISDTITGLTIVSIGTTLPDKIVSIKAALKGHGGILTANTVGSNIFLITLVLGVSAIIQPITIDSKTLYFDIPIMLGSSAIFCLIILYGSLYRWMGCSMILLYFIYIMSQYFLVAL